MKSRSISWLMIGTSLRVESFSWRRRRMSSSRAEVAVAKKETKAGSMFLTIPKRNLDLRELSSQN